MTDYIFVGSEVQENDMSYSDETRCIHSDKKLIGDHPFGAISVPIFQSATFAHPDVDQSSGYDYSRESNPTRSELEEIVSSLENASDSIATSTGMAAIVLAMSVLPYGSHVICTEDLYGGSVRLFKRLEDQEGFTFTYTDTSDAENIVNAINEKTKAVFIETPSNPTMRVTDIAKVAEITGKNDLLLIVDNTFLTPIFQKPLLLGADISLHSGTKFLSGHNDTLAGFVCVKDEELAGKLRFNYKTTGASLSAFDSFLVIRGIKTLHLRLERQQKNALKIAEALKANANVKRVYYAGLEDSSGYEIMKKQATGFGSMISFSVTSSELAKKILKKVKLISYAESLGGVESLITYPLKQTHGDVPEDVRNRLGITDDFLRLSVGVGAL